MAKPVRVMLVSGSLGLGGAETQAVRLAGALDRSRFEPILCALALGGPLEEQVRAMQVPLHICGLTFSGRCVVLRTLLGFIRFYLLLWRYRPAVLHCFLYTQNVVGSVLGRLAFVPVIITTRRSMGYFKDGSRWRQPLENFTNKLVDAVAVNSRGVWQDVLQREKINPALLRLTYNGVPFRHPPAAPARMRQELGLPPAARVVLCVANLFPYKGHRDLLAALARVRAEYAQPVVLALVGRDEGELEPLQALAAELDIADRVRFLGEQRDAGLLFHACDIAVLASHQEGFSNAVLEAMAAGKPSVVTDVGGNAEAVTDGLCGFVVPPHAPDALAGALLRLLRDPGLCARMGEAARRRACEVFSLQSAAGTAQDLYRELLQRKAPRLARRLATSTDKG